MRFTRSILHRRGRRGAIIVSPFGGGTLIGKLGSSVFQRGPYGNVVRTYVKPVNPNTVRQTIVRAFMTAGANAWNSLTAGQRDAWRSYASLTPFLNKTGNEVRLSGRGMYMRTVMVSQLVGLGTAGGVVAPSSPGLPNLPQAVLAFDALTGNISVTAVVGVLPTNWSLICLTSGNIGLGRSFFKGPFESTLVIDQADILPVVIATNPIPGTPVQAFVQFRFYDVTANKLGNRIILPVASA